MKVGLYARGIYPDFGREITSKDTLTVRHIPGARSIPGFNDF
jgi:hypothetical protein